MNDDRGLYEKFTVRRNDGQNGFGDKHYGCEYFVLDLTHDAAALPALIAYAVPPHPSTVFMWDCGAHGPLSDEHFAALMAHSEEANAMARTAGSC